MKGFNNFIEEAAAKRCPAGKYWCYTDKKCKKIPMGYHVGRGGYLVHDDNSDSDDGTGKNGNGNGGSGGDSNGGGGNGGGNGGGGGE